MEDRHKRVNPESRPASISNLKSVKALGTVDFRGHSFPYYVFPLLLRIKECTYSDKKKVTLPTIKKCNLFFVGACKFLSIS